MKFDQAPSTDECISALTDGQLDGVIQADTLTLLATDEPALATWQVYQLVGDVLRTGEQALPPADDDFVARLRQRMSTERPAAQPHLSSEPAPAPVSAPVPDMALPARAPAPQPIAVQPAANDGVFRWKLVAGLASFTAVGLLGWQLLALIPTPGSDTLAQAPQTPAPRAMAQVSAEFSAPPQYQRDPRMTEWLLAHRQVGGGMALQHPNGFLRNATFEVAER